MSWSDDQLVTVLQVIKDRANCIERNAVYEHEIEFANGLRTAAALIADSRSRYGAMGVVVQGLEKLSPGEEKSAFYKVLSLLETDYPLNDYDAHEMMWHQIEALKTELQGLRMLIKGHVDISDRT